LVFGNKTLRNDNGFAKLKIKSLQCYRKQNKLPRLNLLGPTISSSKVFINQLDKQMKSKLPSDGPNKFFPTRVNNAINNYKKKIMNMR